MKATYGMPPRSILKRDMYTQVLAVGGSYLRFNSPQFLFGRRRESHCRLRACLISIHICTSIVCIDGCITPWFVDGWGRGEPDAMVHPRLQCWSSLPNQNRPRVLEDMTGLTTTWWSVTHGRETAGPTKSSAPQRDTRAEQEIQANTTLPTNQHSMRRLDMRTHTTYCMCDVRPSKAAVRPIWSFSLFPSPRGHHD